MNEQSVIGKFEIRRADLCYAYAKPSLGALISLALERYGMSEARFDNDDY